MSLFLLCTCVRAQDARFSQLHATQMLSNPALTGVMNGGLRVTLNYQTRYMTLDDTEGFRSIASAVEVRKPLGRQNFVGLAAQLQHDRAGHSDFVRSQGMLSGSYQQQVASGQFISGGAQVGVGQRGYDLTKLWFSDQYFVDPVSRAAYVDRSLPNGEPFGGQGSRLYLDMNAGVAYFASLGDRRGYYAGAAAYHLNRPNVSPLPGEEDLLDRRYVVHAGGELALGRGYMSVLPSGRAMVQGPSLTALVGSQLRYTERSWREIALRIGGYLHLGRGREERLGLAAIVALVGLEYDDYHLGLSYDLSVGALNRPTAGRGGFELSVVYSKAADRKQRVRCPRF